VVNTFRQSLSPGNEQREFWGSAVAGVQGSRNLIGIEDPVVDALIETVVAAPDREGLIAATRALDRVLLWRHFVVPQWHVRVFRIVYWNKFGRPAISPKYALGFTDTWWVDPDKARALEAGAESLKGQ
jgi:microcin C transport system substrate-binding protein